jgi:putative ABC transport system ATP-binding protein
VMEVFQQLNRKGITIILVTHEPDIAEFAKRQIVFRDGRLRADRKIVHPKLAAEALKGMPLIDDEEEMAITRDGVEG